MAIHVSSINGMGASTIVGSTITNTGMKAEDHMAISEDFITNAGVGRSTDLAVAQNGTPNMSINVGAGVAYILNPAWSATALTETKFWRLKNSADYNVAISANASGNPRITSIFAKIDTSATPNDDADNVASFVAVDGTPAGSPTAPATPSDGNGYLRLADITVANGASSIVTANISSTIFIAGIANVTGPDGMMVNGKISVAVASNNITLSLLTKSGNTPSTTDWVYAVIGGVGYKITSALTVTKNAGTNWFGSGASELATKEIDYFAFLGYNATDGVVIGFARIPYAKKYGDFSTTTTNERYCAISTITNASSNDPYVIVGRFAATLSATASFNWSVPAYTPDNLIQRPIFETRWLDWTTTYSGYSANPTNIRHLYKVADTICYLVGRESTDGTSNNATTSMSVPFTKPSVSAGSGTMLDMVSAAINAGYATAGISYIFFSINSGANIMTAAGFNASGSKRIGIFSGFMNIGGLV